MRKHKIFIRHKNVKSFSREEALFEIRKSRQNDCQLQFTENVLQDVFS